MSAPFLQTCFAAMASDDVRVKSSSGGAFTVFARWILARGGVVVGAAFVDQMECAYVAVEDEDGLKRLRGSKYVRAKLTKDVLEAIRWHTTQLKFCCPTYCRSPLRHSLPMVRSATPVAQTLEQQMHSQCVSLS